MNGSVSVDRAGGVLLSSLSKRVETLQDEVMLSGQRLSEFYLLEQLAEMRGILNTLHQWHLEEVGRESHTLADIPF